ncbi:hypothetical protein MMC20_005070 [Loxospora ochrophaea]|nr:hypothetical protein [Loxospora ochrophaea]
MASIQTNRQTALQLPIRTPVSPLLFLVTLSTIVHAQSPSSNEPYSPNTNPTSTESSTPTISDMANNGGAFISPVAATSAPSNIPAETGYGATDGDGSDGNVFNYFFLLILVFVVLLALGYWFIVCKRKKKLARARNSGENALARDLEGWTGGRRWGPGRWRPPGLREARPEEGLNERGEAPPPYVPEPPAEAHHGQERLEGDGQPIPLRPLSRQEVKPPDYEQGLPPMYR